MLYLVDFGAVQNTYHNTLMQGSTVVGTYGYMSPEQFRGKAVPATDLYSLGATLVYLLTHRSPAELPQDTLKLDFRASVNISEEFGDWLDKILEPSLEYRYTSAKEAWSALLGQQQASKNVSETEGISGMRIVFMIISSLAAIALFFYYWKVLSFVGYHPINICHSYRTMSHYLNFGEDPKITVADRDRQSKPLSQCNYPEYSHINLYDQVLFLKAVKDLDREAVESFIDRGVDVNFRYFDDEFTPLHWAIHKEYLKEDPKIVRLLVDNNADLNIIADGMENNINLVRYQHTELTPFSLAVKLNDIKIIELLINSTSNIKYDYRMRKDIQNAVLTNNTDLIVLLLSNKNLATSIKKESFNYRNRKYYSLIDFAKAVGNEETIAVIEKSIY